MFGSEMIEMAIGLCFVYLMFSLICSGFKEWIHYLLNIRAKALEEQIGGMLKNSELVKSIYSHNLVQQTVQSGVFKKIFKPTAVVPTTESSPNGAAGENQKKPIEIPAESFSIALLESIGTAVLSKGTSAKADKMFWDVKNAIEQVTNNEVKKVLTDLIDNVQKDEEKLVKKLAEAKSLLEGWFDTTMQKLSKWYERKSKQLIFLLALVLTITFNVDTIMMVKSMSQNPALRSSLYTQAMDLAGKQQQYLGTPQPVTAPAATTPSPAATTTTPAATTPAATTPEATTPDKTQTTKGMNTTQFFTQVNDLRNQAQNSGMPLGWVKRTPGSLISDPRQVPPWGDPMAWVYKLLGLFISLMAISMGAPFWFKILKNLLSLRKSSGGDDTQRTKTPAPTPVPTPLATSKPATTAKPEAGGTVSEPT